MKIKTRSLIVNGYLGVIYSSTCQNSCYDSVVSIATLLVLDGPGIKSRWRRDSPCAQSGPETSQAFFKMITASFVGLCFRS